MKYLKVSFFITILGLFFIGVPQFNSKAEEYDNVSGLSIPNYIMEVGGSSNIYEPKFHEPDSFNNITLQQYIENMKNGSHTYSSIPLNYMYILSVNVNPDDVLRVTFKLDGQQQQSFDGINLIVLKKLENSISIRFYDDYNSSVFASFNLDNNSNDIFGLEYIFEVGASLDYQNGYNDGYDYGLEEGWYSAYDEAYDTAKNYFGYNYDGTIISGNDAYLTGYQKATQNAGDTKASIINFIPGVLGAIFMFFFQIGQIGILGITILDVLGILVLISSLIFVIKFFF